MYKDRFSYFKTSRAGVYDDGKADQLSAVYYFYVLVDMFVV